MNIKSLLTAAACACVSSAFAYDTPTMGWSSWNAYGFRINEDIIKAQADAMETKGLRDAGYVYLNIDDGAFCGRDESGRLRIHPTRFPNGMKTVVDYIHSKGLKAGTYSDAGANTCASFWGGDLDGIGTGLYGHDEDDIRMLFGELGFEFIKVDFCGGDAAQNADRLQLSEKERYTAISEAIAKHAPEGARLNVCRWAYPGTWVKDVASSWRVTQDIYLGWASVADIVHQNLYLSAYAGEGRFNDMDMLEVGRGMSAAEDATHFAMWCMMSSPLLLGCDLSAMTDDALALVTNPELIAINQDPLALQAQVVGRQGQAYVLAKDLDTLRGTRRAVALYNPADVAVEMEVDFYDLELGGKVEMRDAIGRTDLPAAEGYWRETVAPHSTRVYVVEAERRLPRTVYEAETAWISAYQELENNQAARTGIYEEADGLSGGAKASWLGQSKENDLRWKHVWSENGGEYTMTVRFISGADRRVNVDINGATVASFNGNSGGWTAVATIDIPLTLRAGDNEIRLWNDSDWMPDIDCMLLTERGSLDYWRHALEKALRRAAQFDSATLPPAMQPLLADAIEANGGSHASRADYEQAIADIEAALAEAEAAVREYSSLLKLRAVAEANMLATEAGSARETLADAILACDEDILHAKSSAEVASAADVLADAMRCHLADADAVLSDGASWDATILLSNPDFDSSAEGWSGNATVSWACAEHWNKTFDTAQTIYGLRKGHYRVDVQALYRVSANDGGTQYVGRYEKIPAVAYANDSTAAIASLYSVKVKDYPELAVLSGTHVLLGYVNSMYGASRAFALGLYENSIDVMVEDGNLTVGVRSDSAKGDCWCCFDNFRLTYLGNSEAGIESVEAAAGNSIKYYDLRGIPVAAPQAGAIVIRVSGDKAGVVRIRDFRF